MKKREEEHWEELGDEDLIEKRRGPCNPIGIFWEGSRDSQGCDPAPSNRVKEIFRHIIMSSILCKPIIFFASCLCAHRKFNSS